MVATLSTAPAVHILARLLRGDPTALLGLSAARRQQIVDVARAHGVEAWLVHSVPEGPEWIDLRRQRSAFSAAAVRARAELHRFAQVAEQCGVAWVALKGLALADEFYPRPDMRFGVDTDVLVDPRHFGSLLDTLGDHGWQLLDRNWPLLERHLPSELTLRSPTGGLLDLHWHLVNDARLRSSVRLPTAELLARRRLTATGLPVLDEADLLVHVAVHAALSGANRLQWLVDVRLVGEQVRDWEVVGRRATAARVTPAVAMVVERSRHWLGLATAPDEWSSFGASAGWWRLGKVVDRCSPLRDDPERPSVGRAFARATRPTGSASMGNLCRRAVAYVGAGAPRVRPISTGVDDDDPMSARHVVDAAQNRRAYFEAVLRSAAADVNAVSRPMPGTTPAG